MDGEVFGFSDRGMFFGMKIIGKLLGRVVKVRVVVRGDNLVSV